MLRTPPGGRNLTIVTNYWRRMNRPASRRIHGGSKLRGAVRASVGCPFPWRSSQSDGAEMRKVSRDGCVWLRSRRRPALAAHPPSLDALWLARTGGSRASRLRTEKGDVPLRCSGSAGSHRPTSDRAEPAVRIQVRTAGSGIRRAAQRLRHKRLKGLSWWQRPAIRADVPDCASPSNRARPR
jgi:hypothetical protein